MQLKTKIHSKKEKIKRLKSEIATLQNENNSLKTQITTLTQNPSISNNLNNNDNSLLISELRTKLKQLEHDNESKGMKILHLERIKNEEIALMNQKIKDFEIMLNDNSVNYVKDISQFRTQIDNYKMQILNYEKYIDIVNYFISKVNIQIQLNMPSMNNVIKDITELQNVLFQIESFINEMVNIRKYGINKECELEKDVPKFENKFIEEEILINNKDKSCVNKSEDSEGGYKTLEERVNVLESKVIRKNASSRSKQKGPGANRSIIKRNEPNEMGCCNSNQMVRSKSMNKKGCNIAYPGSPVNAEMKNIKVKKKKKGIQLQQEPLRSPGKKHKNKYKS